MDEGELIGQAVSYAAGGLLLNGTDDAGNRLRAIKKSGSVEIQF